MPRPSVSSQRFGSSTPTMDYPQYRGNIQDNQRPSRPSLKKNPRSGTNISLTEEEEYYTTTLPISPPIPFKNMRSPSFSSAKVKIKPLTKKKSLDTPGIDLSKSMAENEGLGIFTQPPQAAHTRSSSGVSSMTVSSVNHRNGPQYRHHGYPYTPPISASRSRAQSSDDLPSTYAPVPKTTRTSPPLHIRTHSTSSNPRATSSSQLHLDNPPSASSVYREPFSPESMGRSGRSSIDSVFRRRKTNDTDIVAGAARAREEFAARQEAKRIKRAGQEARLREKVERKEERRSRSGTTNTLAMSEKGSTVSSIKYTATRPEPLVDKELEMIRAGVRPRRQRQNTSSTLKKKARGTKNAFEKFFYDLHTAWLKLLHSIGLKKDS